MRHVIIGMRKDAFVELLSAAAIGSSLPPVRLSASCIIVALGWYLDDGEGQRVNRLQA